MARTPNDDRSDGMNIQTPAGQANAENHQNQLEANNAEQDKQQADDDWLMQENERMRIQNLDQSD